MKKLYYYYLIEEMNSLDDREKLTSSYIKEIIPSTSEWYSSLPFFKDGFKSVDQFYSNLKNKIISGNHTEDDMQLLTDSGGALTAKNCPGIKTLFKQSFLITTPCDIHISINKEREMIVFNMSDEKLISLSTHNDKQYKTKNNKLFENRINVKFEIPIYMHSQNNWIFMQPTYHSDVPWEVMPGVVNTGYTALNVNTLFPFETKDYLIKKGTPLCYLYFDEKHKLEYTNKRYMHMRTTFLNSGNDVFK